MTSDSDTPTPPKSRRSGVALTLTAVAVGAVAAVALIVVAVRSGGDDTSNATHGGGTGAQGGISSMPGHDAHDGGAVLTGCDAQQLHNSMMMFDPLVADGLLDSGCEWPYDAAIQTAGGAEDPTIETLFEPRRYAEVFDVVAAERFGMCAVSNLPDPSVDGFVFGFRVAMQPDSCVDGEVTVEVAIREYATRAWRDTAAVAAANVGRVVILGRWVVSIAGTDMAAGERFAAALEPLGGVLLAP